MSQAILLFSYLYESLVKKLKSANNNSEDNTEAENSKYDNLADSPQYRIAYENIYYNNTNIPLYPGAYAVNDLEKIGGGISQNKQPKLEVKKAFAIQNDFYVDKTSIKLIKEDDSQKTMRWYLYFKFSSKIDFTITLYYGGRETIDKNKKTDKIFVDETLIPIQSINFGIGSDQEFPKRTSIIDNKSYSKDLLTSYDIDRYPLIIKMETRINTIATDDTNIIATSSINENNKIKKFYVYCTFTFENDCYIGKVLKQKFEMGEYAYILDDIFGIGASKLVNSTTVETKDCTICLVSKIDTIVLPCKHMCICFDCAKNLRTNNNNKCPICRKYVDSFMKLEND